MNVGWCANSVANYLQANERMLNGVLQLVVIAREIEHITIKALNVHEIDL